MGVVFRARDTRLNRDVAIKLLPGEVALDADRLARFQREAQALAALNHPNIAQIYGLEPVGASSGIVMELVEGETLQDRLQRGSLRLEETLDIVRQLIDALSDAHERGIVHSDLKPANIKLTPDGKVKVLDFGLAKIAAKTPPSSDASQAQTMMTDVVVRVVMGTPAYMSPEQARGMETDSRTDVWAFGSVLYEMLSGRQAFSGETVTDIIARVIEGQPNWDAISQDTPASVWRLLKAALTKDPKQRLQHIKDARFFLDGVLIQEVAPASKSYARRTWLAAAGGLVAGALIPTAFYLRRTEPPLVEPFRLDRAAPGLVINTLTISPDGRYIAYVAQIEGKRAIWAGPLGQETRPLIGTENATGLFWSPDSHQIGFFALQTLKKTSLSGGVTILTTDLAGAPSGTWNRNGVILFSKLASSRGPAIVRITERGGDAIPVTEHDPAEPAVHLIPQFLPDGEHFLFHHGVSPGFLRLKVGSLRSKNTEAILDVEQSLSSPARYAEPGYLLFSLNGTLMAQRFDSHTRRVAGSAEPLVEQVRGTFSVSDTGRLVYWIGPRTSGSTVTNQLRWFDRKGNPGSQLGESATYGSVALSRDERKVAVDRSQENNNRDLYVLDVDRGTSERLTSHESVDTSPVWEPAGGKDRIAFTSQRGDTPIQNPKLFVRPSISSVGQDSLLYDAGTTVGCLSQDWSSEGLVFVVRNGPSAAAWDLWIHPFPEVGKPRAYLETPFRKAHAQVSPNGKWIAYTTNETGSDQIVIQSFPDAGLHRRTVTANGGTLPRWRKDGQELYYLAADGKLMAVPIKDDASMTLGETTSLFPTQIQHGPLAVPVVRGFPYDVAKNGQLFLVINPLQPSTTSDSPGEGDSIPITAILDWTALLPVK